MDREVDVGPFSLGLHVRAWGVWCSTAGGLGHRVWRAAQTVHSHEGRGDSAQVESEGLAGSVDRRPVQRDTGTETADEREEDPSLNLRVSYVGTALRLGR